MVAATITDTYLLTTPWERKTDFYNALKTALTNAGFTTDVNEYDRRDAVSYDWLRSANAVYEANGANSIKGIIKQVVLDGTKAKGTVQFDFFSTKNGAWANMNPSGVSIGSTDYPNQAMSLGVACYWGGWDSANARRTLHTLTDTAIGSWFSTKPTYTVNMHNNDGALRSGQFDGNVTVTYDTSWNSGGSTGAGNCAFGFHFTPGYSSQTGYFGDFYGLVTASNPLCRLPNQNAPVQFKAINHPEMKGVFILQHNRAPWFLGYVRPATKPTWWNEDNFPYVFIPVTPTFNHFAGFNNTYFPIPSTPWFAWHEMIYSNILTKNTFTNKLDIQSSPMIKYATDNAFLGKFSADFIHVPSEGVAMFDKVVVTAGVEEYLIISTTKSSGQLPSLGIRII